MKSKKRGLSLPFPSLRSTLSHCAVISSMDHRTRHPHFSFLRSISGFAMARKPTVKRTLLTFIIAIVTFAIFTTFFNPTTFNNPSSDFEGTPFPFNSASFIFHDTPKNNPPVKVHVYDLPMRFTYGIIEQHSLARGGGAQVRDLSSLNYPGHQHMSEWYLYTNIMGTQSKRNNGSPVVRVLDPEDADLFFVPFFSSLSLIVNQVRSPVDAEKKGAVYSDEENQDALVEWLEDQKYWRRNGGRDHVFVASDPNALYRVIDKVKNGVLLVSDFGRLRPDQGSIIKDVVIPYAHRIKVYDGDVGIENRHKLLFFMGNRYRKEVIILPLFQKY